MNRRLIVNWRSTVTSGIIPVAELLARSTHPGPSFEFGYLRGVERAQQLGFQPFLAFPEVERRYESDDLFTFFKNRVLPSTRPDYLEHIVALGLDPDSATAVELLGRSSGQRQTDRIETVMEPDHDLASNRYLTRFLVRGIRHLENAGSQVLQLQPGTALEASIEPSNEANPRARVLLNAGQKLGYVPDYLLSDLDALEQAGEAPTFLVEKMNPPPHPVHHRLLVRLSAGWPAGFKAFASPELAPITPGP